LNEKEASMYAVLWVIQGILAVKLIATAVSHGLQHNLETMQGAIQTLAGAVTLLYVAAGLMSLGGAALVLPAFVELPAGFTLAATAAVALLMLLPWCRISSPEITPTYM
jgi:uncharacterized membrane protein YphA (DoxX/SURF4 family)